MMITNVFSFSEMKSWLTKNTVPSLWAGKTRLVIINTFTRFTFSLSLSIRTHTHTQIQNVRLLLLPIQKSRHELRASRGRARRPPPVQRISRAAVQRHERRVRLFYFRIYIFLSNRQTTLLSSIFFNRAQRPDGRSQQTEPRTAKAREIMKTENSLLLESFKRSAHT